MIISLIHPSRGRSQQAFDTYNNWISKSSNTIDIEHILSIDNTDNEQDNYKELFKDSIVFCLDNKNMIQAVNRAAQYCKGDIIILLSDDFDCCDNWDIEIIKAFDGQSNKLLKTYDGIQKWIVTLPIMDRDYYENKQYVYNPIYTHMFCDTDMTHEADVTGCLLIRNDLFFKHNHYSVGGMKKDETNRIADSSFNEGMKIYLKRAKQLGTNGLSTLANTHLNWLKNKI